jgi:hypothetical protein
MTKCQTKFRRSDVNDGRGSLKAQIPSGEPAVLGANLVQRLSWRGFAVRKNFSNRRRKVINARARHDDAIAAAVSFLCDTQESTPLIFPELDIEMLALNLQFSRLDDVVHFALRGRV